MSSSGPFGVLSVEFGHVRAAVPDLADDGHAIPFDPFVRAGERMDEPPRMLSPRAEREIEIMAAVAQRRGVDSDRQRAERAGERKKSKHCAPEIHDAALVRSAVNWISQVLPPSVEYASW
jgi:hypothetical protein